VDIFRLFSADSDDDDDVRLGPGQLQEPEASPRQGFKGGRHLPAQQALNNLAEMASMPGANRFDWPSMIRQMSR